MSNQLTQAELIALVKEAGGIGLSTPQVSFSRDGLAKFAQLIQQRQVAQALEKAARAVEQHNKVGREWIPGSLYDTLAMEAAARIRALIDQPVEHIEELLGMVEQGWDELVEACQELISQYEAVPEFTMGGKLTNGPFIKIREALANRRGGE